MQKYTQLTLKPITGLLFCLQ